MTPTNWGVFGSGSFGLTAVGSLQERIQFTCIFHWLRPINGNILSTFFFFTRKLEVTVSGGSTFARVKLKEIDGMAPQDVERAV